MPKLSVEIRVSYELSRMLGNGEVVAKFKSSWNKLLDRGDEPFGGVTSFSVIRIYSHIVDISFPSIRGHHSSLTLKAAVVCPCNNQDSALFDVSEISLCCWIWLTEHLL
jgi:hypothetical protein